MQTSCCTQHGVGVDRNLVPGCRVPGVRFRAAEETCRTAGHRLCTPGEIDRPTSVTAGLGCGIDGQWLWTGRPCQLSLAAAVRLTQQVFSPRLDLALPHANRTIFEQTLSISYDGPDSPDHTFLCFNATVCNARTKHLPNDGIIVADMCSAATHFKSPLLLGPAGGNTCKRHPRNNNACPLASA